MDILDYRVVKSNKLVEAKSDYSALQQRIILYAIAQIKPDDESFKMYQIKISDIESNRHYDLVKEAVKRLHKTTIEIREGKDWAMYPFITKSKGRDGSGIIELQFHDDIKPFLLKLQTHYTSYFLKDAIGFRGNYTLRIYELCKQYQVIGKRILAIEDIRQMFNLKTKYKKYADFKTNVINSAVAEINSFSDIHVSMKENKVGRKITTIEFSIKSNPAALK